MTKNAGFCSGAMPLISPVQLSNTHPAKGTAVSVIDAVASYFDARGETSTVPPSVGLLTTVSASQGQAQVPVGIVSGARRTAVANRTTSSQKS